MNTGMTSKQSGEVRLRKLRYWVLLCCTLSLELMPGHVRAEASGSEASTFADQLRQELMRQPQLRRAQWAGFYRELQHGIYWFDLDDGWFSSHGFSDPAQALFKAVKHAGRHGLQRDDYAWQQLEALEDSVPDDAKELARAEILLMQSYLDFYRHLAQGRYPELAAETGWHITQNDYSEAEALKRLKRLGPAKALLSIQPTVEDYALLLKARQRMQAIVNEGGWPTFPGDGLLRPGMHDARTPDLRQRLHLSGDLEQPEPQADAAQDPELYDAATVAAVKTFQRRHGLQSDGIVGPKLRAMLNFTAEQRLAQIDANLERLRWLPHKLADDRLMVNIAAYELRAFRAGKQLLEMRVVVGDEQNQTPAFSDFLEYIEINPYWSIPNSIVVNELAPRQLENPRYLASRHMRVYEDWDEDADTMDFDDVDWDEYTDPKAIFPYVIKQDPGPWNALGRIKFMFPNKYSIYLHDTPETELFQQTKRSFSHGCIRVQKPMELAELVLRNTQGWDTERVKEVMQDRDKTRVHLGQGDRMQVYIYYLTAWAGDDGVLYFRPDLYQRDASLIARFAQANPHMLSD